MEQTKLSRKISLFRRKNCFGKIQDKIHSLFQQAFFDVGFKNRCIYKG
jgi:hypothetical protein